MWNQCVDKGTTDVLTLACLPVLVKLVVNAALTLAGLVALIMIIVSGIKYIMSRGDQTAVENAKKTLTWAIIGLFVIFMSFAIIQLISQLTGVSQIANPTFGN